MFNLAINLFASNVFPFLSTTLPCLSFQRILEINFFHYILLSKIYTCLNKTSIFPKLLVLHSKIVSTTYFVLFSGSLGSYALSIRIGQLKKHFSINSVTYLLMLLKKVHMFSNRERHMCEL